MYLLYDLMPRITDLTIRTGDEERHFERNVEIGVSPAIFWASMMLSGQRYPDPSK